MSAGPPLNWTRIGWLPGYHAVPLATNVTTSTAAVPTAIGAAIQKTLGGVRHREQASVCLVPQDQSHDCGGDAWDDELHHCQGIGATNDLEQRHQDDQRRARVSSMAQRRKPNCGPGGKHDEHGDGVERDCVWGHMGAGGIVVSAGSDRIVVFKPRRRCWRG